MGELNIKSNIRIFIIILLLSGITILSEANSNTKLNISPNQVTTTVSTTVSTTIDTTTTTPENITTSEITTTTEIITTTEISDVGFTQAVPITATKANFSNGLVSWNPLGTFDILNGRAAQQMIYYASADVFVLFGGISEDRIYGDTLIFDTKSNSWTNVTPEVSPPPRFLHSMVYDSNDDKIILFGGRNNISGSENDLLGDLWIYDYQTNTWKERRPFNFPTARYYSSMIYDNKNSVTLLFGGSNDQDIFNDIWMYDYKVNNWQFLGVNKDTQSYVGTEAVYDTKRGRMLIFGGNRLNDFSSINDNTIGLDIEIWSFDYSTKKWESYNFKGPSVRIGHSVIYDIANDQVILYGGYDAKSVYSDTWVFDFNTESWNLQSNTIIDYSIFGELVYDLKEDKSIYVTGMQIDSFGNFVSLNKMYSLTLESSSPDLIFPTINPWIAGIVTSVLGFAGVGIFIRFKSTQVLTNREFRKLPVNTKNVISKIFGKSATTYYVIGANFISKKKIDTDLEKIIPSELYEHKFLLHPMRLAMCRILIDNPKLPTKKLREMMGISWSDLSTHTRAMKEKGLIYIDESIMDGKFVQTISLESNGMQSYKKLIQILLQVIDESLLLQSYLKDIEGEPTSQKN